MKRTIYHLRVKASGEDFYYGSIKALVNNNTKEVLAIGIDTLYRYPWKEKHYENENIVIKKGALITTKS